MAKFEESIKELEKIVKTLEDDDPSLEDSLKKFEKGVALIKAVSYTHLRAHETR